MSPAPRAFASFLAAVLVLVPLPWHWRARNIPTISLIVWLFVVNAAHGINVIEWYDNVDVKLEIWCDIFSKLVIGANMAIPAACFCLSMRLEGIAAVRNVKATFTDKRRKTLVDLAICVGAPLIQMALHYVVQGHRFDIIERFGCQPETYASIPEFFLIWFIPILLCIATFVLGGLAFWHFFRRRATFARHLAASNSGLTPSRYFRLMSMSLALMIWNLLIFALTLSFNYRNGLRPWTNWADVHSNWLAVGRYPTFFIPPDVLKWTYFLWWTIPVTAYMFFAFFAFGRDAVSEYGACITWIKRTLFRQHPSTKGDKLSGEQPSFVPISSLPPGHPPRLDSDAYLAKSKEPFTPTTSSSTAGFTFPASPTEEYCGASIYSHYADGEDKEKAAHIATARHPENDPSPPYSSSPSTSPIVTISVPSPALVVGSSNEFIISSYAHTEHIA